MSSIGSLSSIGSTMMTQSMQHRQRPNPTQMAENLFSQIDTSSQGYIEKADLQAALDKASSGSSSSVDDLFTKLDSDSDGKVTKQEFSDVLTALAEQMDQQYSSMRMNEAMQAGGMGGPGGMPPPPPPGGDAGFTKDELSSQLEEIGDSDTQRSSLISSVIENFDVADTDGNGKVSFKEAMAFEQSSSATSASASASEATSGTSGTDSEAGLMLQIMRLMQAYDIGGDRNGVTSTLSVTA